MGPYFCGEERADGFPSSPVPFSSQMTLLKSRTCPSKQTGVEMNVVVTLVQSPPRWSNLLGTVKSRQAPGCHCMGCPSLSAQVAPLSFHLPPPSRKEPRMRTAVRLCPDPRTTIRTCHATSPVVPSTAGGTGSIPCFRTKILHATLRGQKVNKNKFM